MKKQICFLRGNKYVLAEKSKFEEKICNWEQNKKQACMNEWGKRGGHQQGATIISLNTGRQGLKAHGPRRMF